MGKETNSPHAPFIRFMPTSTSLRTQATKLRLVPRVLALQSGPINLSPWIAKVPSTSGVCFLPPAAAILH